MGVETAVLLGAGAVGSFLNSRAQNKATKANNDRYSQLYNTATPYLQNSPTSIEDLILGRYNQGSQVELPNLNYINQSSDAIIQSIRDGGADPFLRSNLEGIAATGNPFDTSVIAASLAPLRQRQLEGQIAELNASAPGLGARFGSANRAASVDLRERALQDYAAIDAQNAFQAYESAQGRRLGATGQLLDFGRLGLARDTAAADLLFRQGDLGLQTAQLGLAQQGQQDQILNLLLNAQNSRLQNNSNILATLAGIPGQQPVGYGQTFTDIGQLVLLNRLLQQGGQTA